MRTSRIATVIILTALIGGLFNNCAPPDGTSTGNPVVSFKIASYTTATNLKMCFKRLRLKANAALERDVNLYLGEVDISPGGTSLGDIELPAGTFSRIEFDLNDDCFGGKSLTVTNANGTFSTSDNIKIRFEGDITITEDTGAVALMIQEIVDALSSVSNNSQIRSAAESAEGEFEED